MARHVIFDLDGTLVDSHAQIIAIIDAMLAARGVTSRVDPVASRSAMSHGGGHLVATLLGTHCGDPDAELADFRARYVAAPTPPGALYPGVAEGLAALRERGVRLALCSNKPQHLCERVLADTGLAPLFEAVVGSRANLPAKPAPDMLLAAAAELGADPGDCLYVGDSEVDHATATAAQVPFLFVRYGYAAPGWAPPGAPAFECFSTLAKAIPAHA